MVSAEDVICAMIAQMAKFVLATLPPSLPSVTNAQNLLRAATGEEYTPPRSKWHCFTSSDDMEAMLFCQFYHLLGAARRFDSEVLGQILLKMPTVKVNLGALREALYRDFLQAHMESVDCVEFMCKKLGGVGLTTVGVDIDARKQFVLEKVVQDAEVRQQTDSWERKVKKVNLARKRGAKAIKEEDTSKHSKNLSDKLDRAASPTNIDKTDPLHRSLQALSRIQLQDLCREEGLLTRDGCTWLNNEQLMKQLADQRHEEDWKTEMDTLETGHKRKETEDLRTDIPSLKRFKR